MEVVLDGCCSEGGGAHGLVQAGHYVVGVDTDETCRDGYLRSGAHEFVCASILDVLADKSFMARFTSATLHPPCQYYSWMSNCRPDLAAGYPELISPIRPLADALGIPYLIENVEGARAWLRNPVTMCMWMFGRKTYRHRLLEAGGGLVLTPPVPGPEAWLVPEGCIPARRVRINADCGWPHPVPTTRAGHWEPGCFVSVAGHERKQPVFEAMELSTRPEGWMSNRERVKEAIPPYLGYWLARQLAHQISPYSASGRSRT
jgi:DNA (cytosine-5)-methyltransferase 1